MVKTKLNMFTRPTQLQKCGCVLVGEKVPYKIEVSKYHKHGLFITKWTFKSKCSKHDGSEKK